MRIEQDIASEEYEDLLARVESLEKTVKDLHIGGTATLGNVMALGLLTGIFRSGTGIKDVDLTGFQMDGDELVGQASGVDQIVLDADTGVLTAGAGEVTIDADGIAILGGAQSGNKIIWEDADENLITEIYAETGGTTGVLNIVGYGTSATYPDGKITLTAYDYESNYLARVSLYADSDGTEWVRITPELQVDTINEKTSAAGVTIDSVLLKDNIVDASAYKVGGTAGCDFNGAVTNITVVKGIVTAAS